MSGPNGLYVTRTILSQLLQGDNIDTDSCFYNRLWWGVRKKGFHRDVILTGWGLRLRVTERVQSDMSFCLGFHS